MRSWATMAMSAVCLVSTTLATSNSITGSSILRADDVLERPFADILNIVAAPRLLSRREIIINAAETEDSALKLNSDGTLNVTAWSTATNAACVKALEPLHKSSNPSGNCICYNLPSLDTQTGVFEAELRLYRVSDPRDAFANVSPQDVKVGVQYHGASVSPISANELMGKGNVSSQIRLVQPRDVTTTPTLVQSYMFVGQIDKAKMAENMSLASFEAVLIPTFTLTATNAAGLAVSTNVSLNEASFLTGVFSKSVVMSDFSAAAAAVNAEVDQLHNGTIGFILPGQQIMVFPIGTIIMAIWLVLGLAAYGWGTFERIDYAETYKRRMAGQVGKQTI